MKNKKTGTSQETLNYYSKNWDKIANCYDLDDDGFPVDPAWYRKNIYKDILESSKPKSLLDVGCGGGWNVLDALELGIDARGIEPVLELKEHGCDLLSKHQHDSGRITQDDLSMLYELESNSLDCISFLSVLPHVPKSEWDKIHENIGRILKPGGKLISVYRNKLFDLFTFNSITMEFYDKNLWDLEVFDELGSERVSQLKTLIANPDLPTPYHTNAVDKSFGELARVKSNPLTIDKYLSAFQMNVENISYYNYHCMPPLMIDDTKQFKKINHEMEATMSNNWRGNFMAAMFVVEATKLA
jgi:SAM-dependent methyltransferase